MDKAGLDKLLRYLADEDGSDLHIKVGSPPHVRVNGELEAIADHKVLVPADTDELAKEICADRIATELSENRETDFAYSVPGLGRFRVNAFYQRGSVGMVFRRVRQGARGFETLGLPESVRRLAEEQRGLVLVTGPTGSGKTTTLAAIIDHINRSRKAHIITIEDPIEILHRDDRSMVNQREVGFDTLGFAQALRSAMREDPDVILVGEMRDLETVSTALSAAETGHLVLSTLHTIDTVETVNRIVDFFPPNQQTQARTSLAGSLKGTICQRLVQSTVTGRHPALEIMIVNGRIQACITDPDKTTDIHRIVQEGESYGMQTFDQALVKLLEAGTIDLRAAMTAASNPHDLRVELQRRGMLTAGGNAVSRPTPPPAAPAATPPPAAPQAPPPPAAPAPPAQVAYPAAPPQPPPPPYPSAPVPVGAAGVPAPPPPPIGAPPELPSQ